MQLTPTFLPCYFNSVATSLSRTCVTFMALMTGWLLSSPSPLHHRTHSVLRLDPYRPPQPVSPLLQPRRLVAPTRSAAPWHVSSSLFSPPPAWSNWPSMTPCVPQAADSTCTARVCTTTPLLSSKGLKSLLLGPRLGRPLPARSLLPLGPFQGLGPSLCSSGLYRNRQEPDQGARSRRVMSQEGQGQEEEAAHRPQPSPPVPSCRVNSITLLAEVVPRPAVRGLRRRRAYGGKSVLQHMPSNVDLLSRASSPRGVRSMHPPRRLRRRPRAAGRKGRASGRDGRVGSRCQPALAGTGLRPVRPAHATLQVKTRQALYYGSGARTDCSRSSWCATCWASVLTRCSTVRVWVGTRALFSPITPRGGRSRVTFENGKQLLGAGRRGQSVAQGRTARCAALVVIVVQPGEVAWYHSSGASVGTLP